MITKIESITNIGNFEAYNASGDVALKKMNIVYAENGAGKTTLSRILHSLSTDDASIILNHRRIGATMPSKVVIKDDTNHQHVFNGTNWNAPIPEIAVFDAHFVANNIYTGFQISNDHKRHLYQFVLGDSGVSISKKIDRTKTLIERTNADLSRVNDLIHTACPAYDVERIVRMPVVPDIDNRIKAKIDELKIAQNNRAIISQPTFSSIPLLETGIDANNLSSLLSFSIDDIGEEYVALVKQHITKIEKEGIEHPIIWINKGINYASSTKTCPYCGSDLTENKLVIGYNQYFSERFNEILNKVNSEYQLINNINLQLIITQLNNAYSKTCELLNFWKNYIKCEAEIPVISIDEEQLYNVFNEIKSAIENKRNNPIAPVPSDCVITFNQYILSINTDIAAINAFLAASNGLIAQIRSTIRNEADVQKELDALQIQQIRYLSPLKELCMKHQIIEAQVDRLQKLNRYYQQEQKAQSNALFSQYGTKINFYLSSVFATKFQISNIKDAGYRGRSREVNLEYTLSFNGTPIEHDGEGSNSFKNVLSEGDKNTIAFSFFLAKLTTDPNFANKIVVFDDPLTSLDLNRRNATIHQLCILQQQCAQVIVLSHNLHFLVELNSRKVIKKNFKKELQIVNANGRATIQEYQVRKDWIDSYKKSLQDMNEYLSAPSWDKQEKAINAIRISLETFLKLKYCMYIPNPEETFGTIVSNLENSACHFINSNKQEVIDKLNQLVSISWRGHHGSIEERNIYSEVVLSSAEAQQYVNMTLNLINSEL